MKKGLLIAFEGIDGTGKSTQLPLLAQWLRQQNYNVVETREPTDGFYGMQIRKLYQNRSLVSPEEELNLFLLDRQEHVRECIQPALDKGQIILTDRYYFSTAAYQGAAACDPEEIFRLHTFAPKPDLVLLLTMPVSESLARIRKFRGEQLNDFEQQEQLEKVATFFASFPQKCIVRIQAADLVQNVQMAIRHVVQQLLEDKGVACIG